MNLKNKVTTNDFEFLYIIGKGGFGSVWKVKSKDTGLYLAIKKMSKAKIIDESSVKSIIQEKFFLSKMNNPFIVNMLCSFQDKDNIYLVLQLIKGGDLRYHLTNYLYSFTETQLKFLFTNLILGLEYIHSKNIIHRDLKPENILFDFKGYAYITDFGIAWSNDEDHKGDISGTPCYMAPESLLSENNQEQDFCVDFYSLGVIGYEIIMSKTPYDGNSRHEIRKQMEKHDAFINIKDIKNFSNICIEFINGLLAKDPKKRLGAKYGSSELKEHIFFKGLNWDMIYSHKYLSPIYDIIKFSRTREGEVEELYDVDFCAQKDSISKTTLERYNKIRSGNNYSKYFENYEFICVDNILEILPKNNEEKIIKRASINDQNNKQLNDIILKRSQSITNIKYPNINGINKGYLYKNREAPKLNEETKLQNYRNVSRSNGNIKINQNLKLPYIQNKINDNISREQKIKGNYENKLLRYKDDLNKLHLYYLKKEKEFNNQNKINNGKGFKILIEKNKGNITPQPIKIPEIQYNIKNLRYDNYNDNQNQQQLNSLNNNKYVINSNYGYYPNNNCNCCCNCMHNCCNCMHNCCCHKRKDAKVFLDKMSINRDYFFHKGNNDYNTDLNNIGCCCCCSQSFNPINLYLEKSLYQKIIEKLIPLQIFRNKNRYITIGRNGSFVEIVETSTDKDGKPEAYEFINNYPPIWGTPNEPEPPGENKVINYKTKKIYEYETRYYNKIIRVHKHMPRKRKPKEIKPKKEEPKKEAPKKEKPKKEKPKKEEPKKEEPKKEEPKKKKPKKKKPIPIKIKKEPEPKKAKAPSLYCSTCSRKITPLSEFSDLKQIEEEVNDLDKNANNKNDNNDNEEGEITDEDNEDEGEDQEGDN